MTTIELYTRDQEIFATSSPVVSSGDKNSVKLKITFDSEWNSYTKTAVFYKGNNPVAWEMLLEGGECIIPSEVTSEAGYIFIGVRGIALNNKVKTSALMKYNVSKGANGNYVYEPTDDIYKQILEAYNLEKARLDNLLTAETVDAELIDIRAGADGDTYPTAGEAVRTQLGIVNEKIDNVINPYIILKDYHKHNFFIPAFSTITISTVDGSNFTHSYNKLILYDADDNEIDYYGITNADSSRTITLTKDVDIYKVALSLEETADIKVCLTKPESMEYQLNILKNNTLKISDNNKLNCVSIYPLQIRNGTLQNASNGNCISTPVIFTKAKVIEVYTDRPNKTNCVYHYEFITVTDFVNDVNGETCYENKVPIDNNISNTYSLGENGVGVQICLAEIDTTTNTVSRLRKNDFEDYTITVLGVNENNETSIPDCYIDYLDERIKTIRNNDVLIGNSGDSFIFITDTHNDNNYYSASIADKIMSETSVNKIVYGGDYINEPSSKEQAVTFHFNRMSKMRVKDNVVFVKGNHDTNPYGTGQLTSDEYYSIYNKHVEEIIDTDKKCYFFKDNKPQKIRYFHLDTGEFGVIDETQINWFNENITPLTSDWTVIIFMHHALKYSGVIDDRTNFTHYEGLIAIENVLSNVNCNVACVIGGHTHIDMCDTTGDFPIIVTTCDAHGIQASHATTDDRTANTINEQAFDVFHIDTTNKKIYATRIGGGQNNVIVSGDYTLNDRVFKY